jgi:hypothetical protein
MGQPPNTTAPLLLDHPQCAVWANGAAMVVEVRGAMSSEAIRALHQLSIGVSREHPTGVAMLSLVSGTSIAPQVDEHLRSTVLAMLRDPAVHLRASALVIPGSGLLRTLARSLLAGLVLLAGSPAAIRIFASIAEAETWLHAACQGQSIDLPPAGEIARQLAARRLADAAPTQQAAGR